jgi:cell division protein ZapB
LTLLVFYLYSVPMEAEMNALDEKIAQLAKLCQKLRGDNSALRQQLATAQSENKRLTEKVGAAKQRLESLLGQIPEASE